MTRSLPAVWRDAIRDSELDRTARLVAFVISTYMSAAGAAWPSKATIAAGAKLGAGRRAVDAAVERIEAAGFLAIERSKGRVPFRYFATVPTSHVDATLFERNVALSDTQRRTNRRPTSHRGATESAESAERGRRRPVLEDGRAPLPLGECVDCHAEKPLAPPNYLRCHQCEHSEANEKAVA